MGQAERSGYAISLEVIGLKAETLLEAIQKIINDQKYLVNVQMFRCSEILRCFKYKRFIIVHNLHGTF
jgi:hypothetical protein